MKILCYCPAFYPSLGGLEAIMEILAEGFVRRGHDVKVVSTTPDDGSRSFTFDVVRNPNPWKLLKLLSWADVYFQGNISLKGLWPLAFARRPYVASHHGWYCTKGRPCAVRERVKNWVTRFATNIAVSKAVAGHIPASCAVIPNAYRDDLFGEIPGIARDRDLVFVGRLVSDKGVDVLLQALAYLRDKGVRPALTIIGLGPEEPILRDMARELDLDERVEFAGVLRGEELAGLLNAHRIMVVPSRWEEPFGIVALEGIACGCVVVGSSGGGLPEAIGPCGVTFPNGDAIALAEKLQRLLADPCNLADYRTHASEHLSLHTPARVANAYLHVLEEAVAGGRAGPVPHNGY